MTNAHTDYVHFYSNAVVKYNYIHVCINVFVCVCIYIYIYIYIYIILIYYFNGRKGPQRQKCPGSMRVKMLL